MTITLALALAVAALNAARLRGYARLFHPLSLPLAVIAVMSLGAPTWVQVTHDPAGLLFDTGHDTATSPLAVAVSSRAAGALVLVAAGYFAAAAVTLALIPGVRAVGEGSFAFPRMRQAGLVLMALAAVAEAVVAWQGRGIPYGAGQFEYGAASVLQAASSTLLLAGLAVVTLRVEPASRLLDVLRGREWAALGAWMLAVALSGGRGGLIAPVVYLVWVHGTRVRAIRLRWAAVVFLSALIIGSAITSLRIGDGLSPGSPGLIASRAVSAVSSPAWLTQQTAEEVPFPVHYLHGSTYEAAAEGQMPGPVSRHLGASTRTASAVFRNLIGFTDPDQGFAESYPSEAYLNFGLPGCLLAGLFLGWLLAWAWRKARVPVIRPRDLLYPMLLAGLVAGFRSDALAQVKEVLYPVLVIWVLMTWYRVRTAPR